MSILPSLGSFIAKPGQQISLASLFNITPSPSNPAYLVVSGIDRNEYTVTGNGEMGSLNGNGATQNFASVPNGDDASSVGILFAYNAATGQYTNATYGNLSSLTYTASTNPTDLTSLSIFGTNNSRQATAYVNDPYSLIEKPSTFTYDGSVSVTTQPGFTGTTPTQATPGSICSVATSFIGKAWNQNGCWVLASDISAEAGASLPLTSTDVGTPGVANGEWIVAYNGPTRNAGSNWWQQITAGEIVAFETTDGGGHITTVVSGSGNSAKLVDNIVYTNSQGTITNPANDGSANDVTIATPHLASNEFAGTDGSNAVIYELDTPVVTATANVVTVATKGSSTLGSMFKATNPLASQAITQYQVYDSTSGCGFTVGGVAETAHTAT
ncbi:MAG: hypothetical protein HQL37_11265, partial [Alphaproteobacteria bacterium]|nr:hypothetical protein [Alphaproteobacteria bacterium]